MNRRASAARRGYGRRWQKARLNYLTISPLCRLCEQLGKITRATVVDHITPHKGDDVLFWDEKNWQSLCKQCHDKAKQKQEVTGISIGCQVDGEPIDVNHHWNK